MRGRLRRPFGWRHLASRPVQVFYGSGAIGVGAQMIIIGFPEDGSAFRGAAAAGMTDTGSAVATITTGAMAAGASGASTTELTTAFSTTSTAGQTKIAFRLRSKRPRP